MNPTLHKAIYKSSAGSGKTYTLVLEWLAIVLPYPERFRQVLAITFTNKAAREMRTRILKALSELAEGKAIGIEKTLNERTGLSSTLIREKASQTLALVLHRFGEFSVSTIDSFTHRLLRAFSRELGLPDSFSVELDQEVLISEITDRLLDKVGSDTYVTDILSKFIESRLDEESNWRIENDLKGISALLFKEDSIAALKSIENLGEEDFKKMIQVLIQNRIHFEKEIESLARKCVSIIENAGLSPESFREKSRGIGAFFYKLASPLSKSLIEKYFEYKIIQSTLENDDWISEKDKKYNEVMHVVDSGLRNAFHDLMAAYNNGITDYNTACLIYKNIYSLAVVSQLAGLLQAWRVRESSLHISDFNKKIAEFVSEEDPDYLYWRLGDRYRFFLIDEFQDTSHLQWFNLFPLFENLLAGSDEDSALILVGDSKQAIYRWRAGNVELLEKIAPDSLQVEPSFLDTNYRSGEHIVTFNNHFFSWAIENLVPDEWLGDIYKGLEQKIKPGMEGQGFVKLELFEKDNFKDLTLSKTLDTLLKCNEDGFRNKDIAILVRTNTEGAEIARHLFEHNVPVISPDSLMLDSAPEVRFLLSCFRYLLQPHDAVAIAEIQAFYFGYILKNENFAEQINPEKGLSFLEKEVISPEKLLQLPLYDLAQELIQVFKLESEGGAFLLHFLNVVHEFENKKLPDLSAFLEYWNEEGCKKSLALSEDEDAVRIMTIHKAKGLQFPVVLIPRANWAIVPKSGSPIWGRTPTAIAGVSDTFVLNFSKALGNSWFADEMQYENQMSVLDNINLLYVAFTRAESRLYIFIPKREKKNEEIRSTDQLLQIGFESGLNLTHLKNEDSIFFLGEESLQVNEEKSEQMETIVGFPSVNWKESISILSTLSDSQRKYTFDYKLCQILSVLRRKDDLVKEIEAAWLKGQITSKEKEEINFFFLQAFEAGTLNPLFDGRLILKPELILPGLWPVVADRMVIRESEISLYFIKEGDEVQPEKEPRYDILKTELSKIYSKDINLASIRLVKGKIYFKAL